MTKKLTALLLTLCMAVFLACPALAVQSGTIYDDADLLTQQQADTLAGMASTLADTYQCDVAIQTVKALPTGDVSADAETCFKSAQLGRGDDSSGILLYYADDANGSYSIYTSGLGSKILTDDNYNELCDSYITPAFQSGAYAAFAAFLNQLGTYFAKGGTDAAAASGTDTAATTADTAADDLYVMDTQQVLTQEQATALNDKCAALAKKYQCAVYVATTDVLTEDSAYNDAKTLYQNNGLGYGDQKSGILILDVVQDRKYAVIAFGKGNDILTDNGREDLVDDYLVPKLKDEDYNAAFDGSVTRLAEYMELNAQGTPYEGPGMGPVAKAAIVFGIPLLIALIVCLVFKSQMNTAVEATEADDYLLRDQFHVTQRGDEFLYQTVTVVHHEHDSGTSTDSDGFSGSDGSY